MFCHRSQSADDQASLPCELHGRAHMPKNSLLPKLANDGKTCRHVRVGGRGPKKKKNLPLGIPLIARQRTGTVCQLRRLCWFRSNCTALSSEDNVPRGLALAQRRRRRDCAVKSGGHLCGPRCPKPEDVITGSSNHTHLRKKSRVSPSCFSLHVSPRCGRSQGDIHRQLGNRK